MENEFCKNGPLELVWLAGNKQFQNNAKGKKSKTYKKIKYIDISDLCGEVHAFLKNSSKQRKPISLRKRSILLLGLAILHEMKVEQFLNLVHNFYDKMIKNTIVPTPAMDLYIPQRDGTINIIDMDMGCAIGELDSYFTNGGNNLVFRETGRTVTPVLIQNEPDENEHEVIEPGTSKRHRNSVLRRKIESPSPLPTEQEILAMLRNAAIQLNAMDHTMIEVDLPPPPTSVRNEEFADFFPTVMEVEEGNLMSDLNTVVSNDEVNRIFHGQAGEITPPQDVIVPNIPPPIRRTRITRVQEHEGQQHEGQQHEGQQHEGQQHEGQQQGDSSFQLSSLDSGERQTSAKVRKRGRRLIFDTSENKCISNEDMRRQCEPISGEVLGGMQWKNEAIGIKIGCDIFHQNGASPNRQEIRHVQHLLSKGLDFIQGTGRQVSSRILTELLNAIPRNIPYVHPTAGRNIEQFRQAKSKSNARKVSTMEEVQPLHGPESLPIQFIGDIPIVNIEPVVPESPLRHVVLESPLRPPVIPTSPLPPLEIHQVLDQQRSQSPVIMEDKQTFDNLIPPGSSRRAACHHFATLLNLQKNKCVALTQNECYGPIYIEKIKSNGRSTHFNVDEEEDEN